MASSNNGSHSKGGQGSTGWRRANGLPRKFIHQLHRLTHRSWGQSRTQIRANLEQSPGEPLTESELNDQRTAEPADEPTTTNNGSSDESKPKDWRRRCWDQALEQLQQKDPQAHDRFCKLREELGNATDFYSLPPAKFEAILAQSHQTAKQERSTARRVYLRCVRGILQYRELAIGLARLDPHMIAPAVINGVCALLQASVAEGNLNEETVRDVEEISLRLAHWSNVLLDISSRDAESVFADFVSRLVSFYRAVLEWQAGSLLDQSQQHSLIKVLHIGDSQHQWRLSVDNVKSKDKNCETSFKTCMRQLDGSLGICKWIFPQDPRQRHETVLEQTGVGSTYRDCGQWLLESDEFTTWHDAESTEGNHWLWIRGTVGTGKTTLMARIIQYHLDRSSKLGDCRLAYFYCSKSGDNRLGSSTTTMVQAILRQVVTDRLTLAVAAGVRDAYNDSKVEEQDSPCRQRCLDLLKDLLASGIRIRVMIDALDECEEYFSLLKDLRSNISSHGLHVLISSRAEVDIHEWLPECPLIDVNERMPLEELETYATMEIKKPDKVLRILKGTREDLEDQLIEALLKRAGGMFRYVQLQSSLFTDQRKRWTHPNDVERVIDRLRKETVSGQDLLYQTYDEIVQRNTGDKEEMPNKHRHAAKLYSVVLAAFIPLTTAMLVEYLAHDLETSHRDRTITKEYLEDLSRDILVPVRKECFKGITFDFAHISVKEYLERQEEHARSKIHWDMISRMKLISRSSRNLRSLTDVLLEEDHHVHDSMGLYFFAMWAPHMMHLLQSNNARDTLLVIAHIDFPNAVKNWLEAISSVQNEIYNTVGPRIGCADRGQLLSKFPPFRCPLDMLINGYKNLKPLPSFEDMKQVIIAEAEKIRDALGSVDLTETPQRIMAKEDNHKWMPHPTPEILSALKILENAADWTLNLLTTICRTSNFAHRIRRETFQPIAMPLLTVIEQARGLQDPNTPSEEERVTVCQAVVKRIVNERPFLLSSPHWFKINAN